MNFEDMYPDEWKPPAIEPNGGRAVFLARDPRYDVTLDFGAFRRVWEIVEAEAKHKFPTRETIMGEAALLRGLEAFRTAFYGAEEGFVARVENPGQKAAQAPDNGKPKRVFAGKATTPGAPQPPAKRVFVGRSPQEPKPTKRVFGK